MSSRIAILPDILMRRIAAGEVVERPASVVKELMENSIDAHAGSVSLMIKGSGSDLIRVVDDGDGMNETEALICSERYATSKISKMEDLDEIKTLGFRGEALASISSVCRMMIITRTPQEEEGTQILIDGGTIQEVQKIGANRGTSIEVKNLFFNVPARRKFLKSPTTELRHIIIAFRRIALSNHQLDFSLYIEDEKTSSLRKDTQEARISKLLTTTKAFQLIPVQEKMSSITISGFISRPGEGRKNREDQFIFLNGRYIVNRSLIHGILSGYGPRLTRGEFPKYVLYLEMDPRLFDMNVHPMKIEVRFSEERLIHDVVRRAVQNALQKPIVVPELHLITHQKKGRRISKVRTYGLEEQGQLTLEAQRPQMSDRRKDLQVNSKDNSVLWQLHNRYIISQIKSGLTIIDQHVAHERILFERAVKSKKEMNSISQQLLFPQTVQFSQEKFLVLTDILPYLQNIGFGLKDFGKNTIVIESVPVEIKAGRERELLVEIIETYKEVQGEVKDTWEAVALSFACKSAIKSGDKLSHQEMVSLIDQLFATNEPYFCPHGRPIIVNLSLGEIDKRFGR